MNVRNEAPPASRWLQVALYALFGLSGFCGLIYESIWAQYLRLFVGHAAYAQTVVLVVFIGGMAIGAWAAGRWSRRVAHPLLVYAIVEAIVGVIALSFQWIFTTTTGWAYVSVIPAMCPGEGVCAPQWILAGLLILPQSILLGTTFPLMSAAILRAFPPTPGRTLSTLYFTNSIGAVFGVLVNTFILIPWVGLPGASGVAGTLNVALAIVITTLWWRARTRYAAVPVHAAVAAHASLPAQDAATDTGGRGKGREARVWPLLAVAAITGLSSFIYEISWIRMLGLVLGSSTQAFDLMLSSFILGLALGGYWIRSRIDRIADTVRFLATVQILMGVLAIATLPLYNALFDVMAWMLRSLARTDDGYVLFNVGSDLLAILVMVPATFMAGMTLPLVTHRLLAAGHGEKSIGYVYAANTAGAIIGVIAAVHLLVPFLGLKGTLVAGAVIDIALGWALFMRSRGRNDRVYRIGWALGGGVLAAGIATLTTLDPLRLASGVYRNGRPTIDAAERIEFHQDGKTASVDVISSTKKNWRWINTNGKTDASISIGERDRPTPDEATMLLLGALPLAAMPDAKSAAVIGFGAGVSTHVLLASPLLTRVDTIEIEAAMIDGARLFRPRNERAYTDPRSHVVIDDAKAYFARSNARYDIIVSEPSNPWVSGISNLFSEQFYATMRSHLSENGIFVQWLQLYEIDPQLIGTILRALERHFPNYEIYAVDTSDIVLLARASAEPIALSPRLFDLPLIAGELRRLGLGHPGDWPSHRVGSGRIFSAWIGKGPVNSDYHPYLSVHAPRTRFTQRDAQAMLAPRTDQVPVVEIVENRPWSSAQPPTFVPGGDYFRHGLALRGEDIVTFFAGTPRRTALWMTAPELASMHAAEGLLLTCERLPEIALLWDEVMALARHTVSAMSAERQERLWQTFLRSPCYAKMAPVYQDWLQLFAKTAARDATGIAEIGKRMLANGALRSQAQGAFLLPATASALIALGDYAGAERIITTYWANHQRAAYEWPVMDMLLAMARRGERR